MKKRKDIQQKYKWDFSDYFSSIDDWQNSFDKLSKKMLKIKDFEGKLINKENILSCFNLLEELDLLAEPLYIFANCMRDIDVSVSTYQQLLNKIENKLTEQSVLTSFVCPQLSKLSQDFLKQLIEDKDFSNYKKILKDVLREKQHTLSEESEKLLSGVSSFSRDFSLNFSNFENGDLKFNKVKNGKGKLLPMTQSLASVYLREKDDSLRQNAFIELNSAFGRFNNFLSSNYLGSVKKDAFVAKIRNFNSALDSALFYEDVNPSVYNMLVNKVEENLNCEYKFFELKRKLLGLKKFKLSDIYFNPLKTSRKYTYDEAFETVCSALSLLGKDYIDLITKMYNTCKIDVYPTENKVSGAYKTGAYGYSPVVLTNFSGNFDDVSTLAHELGHAVHSIYSDENQSMFNASYTIFLAEIASTVNETLLNKYMLENTSNKAEKIFYINEFISRFHATVYRQTMFANFEQFAHNLVEKDLPVSSEVLNQKYLELVKKYFGKKVKIFNCIQYEWSRIPHFYTAFYVYKYATGLISAINIVENLKNKSITVDDYKKFLSSGCTQDPISLLKIVKVDLSTSQPFEKAFEVLKRYLKDLEKLIK